MTIDERLVFLLQSTESLHANVQELSATVQEISTTVRETSAAVQETSAMVNELSRTVLKVVVAVSTDGVNIQALVRIAKARERRISTIEGTSDPDLTS